MRRKDSPDSGSEPRSLGTTILTIAVIILAPLVLALSCNTMSEAQAVKSVYWSDGDSGRIDGLKFRLADVDSPETGGVGSRGGAKCERERELGFKAKEFMVELTRKGKATITAMYDVDEFGRQVLDLAIDGQDIGKIGVKAGHLRSYRFEGPRALEPKPIWC